jgi:uncharacterized protein YjeT (DUF2065 family)
MTPIRFTLDAADLLSAVRFGFLRSLRHAWPRIVLTMVVIAAVIAIALAILIDGDITRAGISFLIFAGFYTAVMLVVLPGIYWLAAPAKTRKMIRQMPVLSREQTLSWDHTHIEATSSAGTLRMPFAELHQWAANNALVIVYPADHLLYAFPRRIFGDGALFAQFQTRLAAAGVKRI